VSAATPAPAPFAQGVLPDSLREALREVFARPEYQWNERPDPLQWVLNLWSRLLGWFDALHQAHPAGFQVLLTVMALVLGGLVAHMGYVIWRITRPTVRTPAAGPQAAGATGLGDARAHRARAEELARAGRYAEALAHRFVALVLELERRRALAFHPSKTPAEYVEEARLDAAGRASLAELVARLYRHVFGGVPCDARVYREFGAAADELGGHVAPA
jgi:uncharacterized protein DUF4129